MFYADTSTRLHEELSDALLKAVQTIGFVGRQTSSPVAMYTHPQMAVELTRARLRRSSGDLTSRLGGYSDLPAAALARAGANLSALYMDAPMVCGCVSLWAHRPDVMERLIEPWAECTRTRACILPPGADGQDNRIGLSTRCRPGLQGHCHRGDQSALSIILYEAFAVREGNDVAPYLRNTETSAETWRMCRARLYGTPMTTERASRHATPPSPWDASCLRPNQQGGLTRRREMVAAAPRGHHERGESHQSASSQATQQSFHGTNNCSGLMLTRVAVPTGIQPIFPQMGGPGASLRRLLKPCATEHACVVGADGCYCSRPKAVAIGRCNATHGVEYAHRLPKDGEPAIVSFFNPSPAHVREALEAVANARPRLYLEFEPPVHARVPQAQVLRAVDGQMTFAKRALVHYPYVSAKQLWSAALSPEVRVGFEERQLAIAVFVSNCRGHRAEAIDWLRQRFEVHSYGSCKHGGNTTGIDSKRRQRREGGHFPECLRYRAVLAIENNACEDYVSEKLLEAVRCGAVPIVRTVKGVPDYGRLFGPLPLLDAATLDTAFEVHLRTVLTRRSVWERYIPWFTPAMAPDAATLAQISTPNPHCRLIEVVSRAHEQATSQPATRLTPIHCETWYHLSTPHGIQMLPRRAEM